MIISHKFTKKYEEHAFVLDFIQNGKSSVIKGRGGPIIQAIGSDHLTILELIAVRGANFDIGEQIGIGKEGRSKVLSVLGKISYDNLTEDSKSDLNYVLEKIVAKNELKYVNWLNYGAQAITPRHHALDMIPGVGKTFMTQIITQREDKPFESFEDLEKRVGLRDPGKLIAKKITSEIAENPRMTLFLNK
ncbi:MAG: DUF655 domain-containing protein [Thermoproteota archaeon]